MMAAREKAAPRATAGMAPNANRRSKTSHSPSRTVCTHMIMDRVYGLACSECHKVPQYGWVYQCRQDHQLGLEDPLPEIIDKPLVPVNCDDLDAKAQVAEFLEMSPSIINGIRAGDYTLRQVNKLLTQRETVFRVIKQQQAHSQKKNKNISLPSADSLIASAGTTTRSHRHASVSKPRRDSLAVQHLDAEMNCNYTICGGCRPYFDTRLPMTFETVIDQPALTAADMQKLRIIDPAVARTIGLRPTPQSYKKKGMADSIYMESASASSVEWILDSNAESESNDAVLFPCPGPLHCRAWTLRSGCPYENGGFDDGNRAANHMHDFLNSLTPENSRSQLSTCADLTSSTLGASSTTASTVSLPTTPLAPLIPLVPSDESFDVALEKQLQKKSENRSMSTPSGKRRKTEIGLYTNESDHGMMSDVDGEVEDGVALTH